MLKFCFVITSDYNFLEIRNDPVYFLNPDFRPSVVFFDDCSNSILCIVYSNLSSQRFAAFISHIKYSIDTVPLPALTSVINRDLLPFPTTLCVWGQTWSAKCCHCVCSVIIHNDYIMTAGYCPQSLSVLENLGCASLRWLNGVLKHGCCFSRSKVVCLS